MHRQDAQADFHAEYVKNVDLCNGVPFGVTVPKFKIQTSPSPKYAILGHNFNGTLT